MATIINLAEYRERKRYERIADKLIDTQHVVSSYQRLMELAESDRLAEFFGVEDL